MTDREMVLQYIPIGRQSPVTRLELRRLTGMSDRRIRYAIQDLQEEGHLIINHQDGRGYFLADSPEDVDIWLRIQGSYIRSHAKTARAIAEAAGKQFGSQMHFSDLAVG